MQERGLDVSGHVSRWIGSVDLDGVRWIVTVGPDEAEQVRGQVGTRTITVIVANPERGGIPDPYELGRDGYRKCAALLEQVLPSVAEQIRADQTGGWAVLPTAGQDV